MNPRETILILTFKDVRDVIAASHAVRCAEDEGEIQHGYEEEKRVYEPLTILVDSAASEVDAFREWLQGHYDDPERVHFLVGLYYDYLTDKAKGSGSSFAQAKAIEECEERG